MASQSITFNIPQELAARFLLTIPAEERSEIIVEVLKKTLSLRETRQQLEAELIASCEGLNADSEIIALEHDMDSLSGDGLDEYPWNASSAR